MSLLAIVGDWRKQADAYERDGQPGAKLLRRVADQVDAWAREHELQELTLQQAEKESGLSYSALEHAVREGRIPNAGRKNRPRIRRVDLPRLKAASATTPQLQLAERVLKARKGAS